MVRHIARRLRVPPLVLDGLSTPKESHVLFANASRFKFVIVTANDFMAGIPKESVILLEERPIQLQLIFTGRDEENELKSLDLDISHCYDLCGVSFTKGGVRVPLRSKSGRPAGALRLVETKVLVRGTPVQLYIVTWSPPHSHRGMPISDVLQCIETIRFHFGDAFPEVDWYRANEEFIKPRTVDAETSFAELYTDVGPVEWVISHVWSEKVKMVQRELEGLRSILEEEYGQGWSSVRVYFCVLSNCQLRIMEEMMCEIRIRTICEESRVRGADAAGGDDAPYRYKADVEEGAEHHLYVGAKIELDGGSGRVTKLGEQGWFSFGTDFVVQSDGWPNCFRWTDPLESPFAHALHAESCKGVLSFLGTGCGPFKRAWCLLEYILCVRQGKTLHLCTQFGHLGSGFVSISDLEMVSRELGCIDVSQAGCKDPEDHAAIMGLIREEYKMRDGVEGMNKQIKKHIHQVLQEYISRITPCHASTAEEDTDSGVIRPGVWFRHDLGKMQAWFR